VFLNAGYDVARGRLRIGPTVSFTGQDITVKAFEETGGGSSNLKIFDQKRRSEVWSAGLRASFDLGNWTPWVRVTADEERRDDERFITAMPLTLVATGNTYSIPAYVSDSSWTTAAVGIRGWITPNIGLAATYYTISGRSGLSDQGATATVSLKF
jgi:outer membrane lipase/esterase